MTRKPGLELSQYDERVKHFLESQGAGDTLYIIAVKANDTAAIFTAPGTSARILTENDFPKEAFAGAAPPSADAGAPVAAAAATLRGCQWVYVGGQWRYICA